MTVLIPNEKIAARWAGALEARLRQAPLENFLRSRGHKWVAAGDSRITDNLACAAIYLVEGALNAYMLESRGTLTVSQHPTVGQVACAVSHGMAALIEEANSWRIAALIATARVLAPYSGLDAAAHVAAAAARDYHASLNPHTRAIAVAHIADAAAVAVHGNDEEHALHVMELIVRRVSSAAAGSLAEPRTPAPALSYDLGAATFKSLTT